MFDVGCSRIPRYPPLVKLSVKSDYATRAVLGLARHFPNDTALRVEQLAAAQDVPANYLVQILLELKAKGIAKSVRGKEGGYLLARPPAEITLGDIAEPDEIPLVPGPALSDPECSSELRGAWAQLKADVEAAADRITFQQLLDRGSEKEKMYYI